MDVKDVLEKPLVVKPGDTVSQAAAKMISERRHEAVVFGKDNKFLGIVLARDLVKKKVSDPHRTKIDQFIIEESPLLPGTSLDEVINAFLVNDYRTVPMKKDNSIMLLTKLDVLTLVRGDPRLKGRTAGDVMKFPYCISVSDSLSTARSILKDMNISRVPVVKNGKVQGMVDTLDLLSPIVKGETDKRGEPDEERTHMDDVPASSFMRTSFPVVQAEMPLSGVIDAIVKEQSAAVVEREGKLLGIVTPADVLKLLGREVRGAYVTISGMEDEDDFAKNKIYSEIEFSLKKINKIYPVNYFVAHLSRHTSGKRTKYSFHARLATGKGFFFTQAHEWDMIKAMKGVLTAMEKEIIRKKERSAGCAVDKE